MPFFCPQQAPTSRAAQTANADSCRKLSSICRKITQRHYMSVRLAAAGTGSFRIMNQLLPARSEPEPHTRPSTTQTQTDSPAALTLNKEHSGQDLLKNSTKKSKRGPPFTRPTVVIQLIQIPHRNSHQSWVGPLSRPPHTHAHEWEMMVMVTV
jgi:hypothetical protein